MKAHMSDAFREQNQIQDQAKWLRRFWSGIFAGGIENARHATGRSIEETARLAGMDLSEWMSFEAGGWLPQTPEQLRAVAGALEMSYDRMASWVRLCWSAWHP
jgi:hypothetical protein